MKFELSLCVLGLLLCVANTVAQDADTVAQDEIGVVISGMEVTLTCPNNGNWNKEIAKAKETSDDIADSEYKIKLYLSSKHNRVYECVESGRTYRLYLKAKVCDSCMELETMTVVGVIIADLLITLGVLVLVYYFSKNRKGRVAASSGGRPRGQKMARPPPVPNPDYEPIRKGQREVYAGLESRGF